MATCSFAETGWSLLVALGALLSGCAYAGYDTGLGDRPIDVNSAGAPNGTGGTDTGIPETDAAPEGFSAIGDAQAADVAADESSRSDAYAGPCRFDADCPAICPVASMHAVCVGAGGSGAYCGCTCDGSNPEKAGCAAICAGVTWATCSTCDVNVYGRTGICGCSAVAVPVCVAQTCTVAATCPYGLGCWDGWCQP